MQLTEKNVSKLGSLGMAKSFIIWCFTLTVSLLVVGFPLIVVMATVGALLSIALHPVLPVSGVLLVAGGIILFNILAVVITAAALTLRGVNPQDVTWLSWLHGDATQRPTTVYAACPLTCDVDS